MATAGSREAVVLGAAIVLGVAPFRLQPPFVVQAVERGKQRAGLHLERAARDLLDAAGDPEPCMLAERERAENQQVQGALQEIGLLGHGHASFFSWSVSTGPTTDDSYRQS